MAKSAGHALEANFTSGTWIAELPLGVGGTPPELVDDDVAVAVNPI
jgi:hypothetical protein